MIDSTFLDIYASLSRIAAKSHGISPQHDINFARCMELMREIEQTDYPPSQEDRPDMA